MSDLFTKLLSGFIILVVIVAAITAFRADMLSGGAAYDAFTAVFDCFPFASETAQVAANIGQYGTTLQGLSPSNFINDVTKIFAMTIVCPLLIGAACRLFLPIPAGLSWQYREKYMSSPGYRLKECAMNVVMMPVCAYFTAKLVDWLVLWVQRECPFLHPTVAALGLLVALFAASTIIQMLESPNYKGLIFRHRLITNLLGGVLKILGMNLICFLIVLAIVNDHGNAVLFYGVLLLIYLTVIELLVGIVTGKMK